MPIFSVVEFNLSIIRYLLDALRFWSIVLLVGSNIIIFDNFSIFNGLISNRNRIFKTILG